MRRWVVLLLLLGSAPHAAAEFFVCGDTARAGCANTVGLSNVLPSSDPSTVTDPLCMAVPEEEVPAQKTLIQTVRASHSNGRCHLKRVGNLAVEMTQPEKDVVNAAIQSVLDNQQAYNDAVTNNDLCSATLDELATAKAALDSNLTDDIAGITNIATAKTELQDMMTRLTNAMEKLMRCIRGRAGPPQ